MDSNLTRVLGTVNPLQPQMVDLSTVNSAYRPLYEAYNQQLQNYQMQEQAARKAAEQAQGILQQELGTNIGQIEKQRLAGLESARQTAGEQEAKLRAQARAIGGAPSSGFLELSNQLQKGLGTQVSNIGQAAATSTAQARTQAMKSLAGIEQDLNNTINQINANRTLSLRERDNAIQSAIARAQQSALLQGLYGGGAGEPTPTPTSTPTGETAINVEEAPANIVQQLQGTLTTAAQRQQALQRAGQVAPKSIEELNRVAISQGRNPLTQQEYGNYLRTVLGNVVRARAEYNPISATLSPITGLGLDYSNLLGRGAALGSSVANALF